MRPAKLSRLLAHSFQHRRKVLIKGPPGIGKSEIVAQACRDVQYDLMVSHPAVSDPTDYKGMPAVVNANGMAAAEFLPFGDLRRLITAKKPLVCFIDDVGQAPPSVQAALMQLIQAGQVNGHKISDLVIFVAATNNPKDMAGVGGMIEPVKSRWHTIVELEVSVDDWCLWALDHNMPPSVIAFIRFRPELLHKFVPTRDITNSPCPRNWTSVGDWLNSFTPDLADLKADVIKGAVGDGAATEFLAFETMFTKLPNPDAIIMNPDSTPVPDDAGALYAISSCLARKSTPVTFERVLRYAKRMPKEFEVCLVRDAERLTSKTPEAIANTTAFTAWSTRNAAVLCGELAA